MLPLADPQSRPGAKSLIGRIVAAASTVEIIDRTIGFKGHRALAGVSLGVWVLARVEVIRPNPKLDRLAIRQLECHRIAQIHRLATGKVQVATIQPRHANRHPIVTARRQRLHQGSTHGAGERTGLIILVQFHPGGRACQRRTRRRLQRQIHSIASTQHTQIVPIHIPIQNTCHPSTEPPGLHRRRQWIGLHRQIIGFALQINPAPQQPLHCERRGRVIAVHSDLIDPGTGQHQAIQHTASVRRSAHLSNYPPTRIGHAQHRITVGPNLGAHHKHNPIIRLRIENPPLAIAQSGAAVCIIHSRRKQPAGRR